MAAQERMARAWQQPWGHNIAPAERMKVRIANWWHVLGTPKGNHNVGARLAFLRNNNLASADEIKAGRKYNRARNVQARLQAQQPDPAVVAANQTAAAAQLPYHRGPYPQKYFGPQPPEPTDAEGRRIVAHVPRLGTLVWQMTFDMNTLVKDPNIWLYQLEGFERQRQPPGPPTHEKIKIVIYFEKGTPMMLWAPSRHNLLGKMSEHVQSASLRDHGQPTHVTITTFSIRQPGAAGGSSNGITPMAKTLEEACQKRCVIRIHNPDDALCFDRSMAVLRHQSWRTTFKSKWKVLIDHRAPLQKECALEIRQKVGIDPTLPITLEDVPKYEDAFQVDIRVWVFGTLGAYQAYGPDNGQTNRYTAPQHSFNILLDMTKQHYCPALSMGPVLGHHFWDAELEQKARRPKICSQCKSESCVDKETPVQDKHHCNQCNRRFRSDKCFDIHRSLTLGTSKSVRKKTACETMYQCEKCGKQQERFDASMATGPQWTKIDAYNYHYHACPSAWPKHMHVHVCGYAHCKSCKLYCSLQDHVCFIEKPKKAPKENGPLFFYDFETTCDNEERRHEVNFAHVQEADGTEHEFGDMESFIAFAMSRPQNSIFFAHNAGKFDSNFILEHVLACCHKTPEVLKANGRILDLNVEGIHFRDTYPHVSAPLANFPKMFGLPGEKGYFPHKFNLKSTQTYVGPMPPIEFYCVEGMSAKKRQEVIDWHAEEVANGVIFDFRKEMASYCRQDVTLLRLGMLRYQEIVKEVTGHDPLIKLTIASAGIDFFKRNIMPEKTIENISRDPRRQDSAEGREFIGYMEHQLGRAIKREYKIGQYSVDGFDPVTNTVYEHNGCLFHGGYGCTDDCSCKRNPHSVNPKSKIPFHELAEKTRVRENWLKSKGYTVVTQTSCGLKALRRTPEYKEFLLKHEETEPIQKREALFGGRTDLGRMYWQANPSLGEKLARYVDFCSLYPWCLKYCDLPLGAHRKIQGPEAHTTHLPTYLKMGKLAIMKLTVTCPDDLRFAVLPVVCKESGRLLFRCGQKTGVWTSVEIALALEMGYTVDRVHEIWEYDDKGKIFQGYINTFYKLKAQASKKPDWVKTDADLDEYIRKFEAKEGIVLDKDKISENPGLRAVAKLYLNTSWGRLAMRDSHNMQKTMITNTPEDYFATLNNPAYDWDSSEMDIIGHSGNEKAYFTLFTHEDLTDGDGDHTNPVMGAFVTSHARVKLYKLLRDVGFENVLYMDTDSCIYVETPDNAHVFKPTSEGGQLGDFLGELTDECDGAGITEFVALAPKTYSYRLDNGEEVVKSKGLSLNWKSSQTICFEGYKSKLFNPEDTKLQIYFDSLRKARDTANYHIFTKEESKEIRTMYTKGFVMADWSIRPFGHRDTVAHQ